MKKAPCPISRARGKILFGGIVMAYCAYLRKSRADAEAEAKGAGETLARHETELLQLAARLNLNLTAIYKEVVSGETIASRPKMQQLLAEVEAGAWEGVLVVEITRLARGDTIDQGIVAQAFKYSGTKIITPAKVYDPANEFDEEYFEFGLFMSRREYKMINQRQQRGRLAASQEGKYVGNRAPYGWRRVKLKDQKGWTLEPSEHAPHLLFMYSLLIDEDLGCTTISHELNRLHIPSASGKPWTASMVRGVLTNPVNAGWIRWGRRPARKYVENGVVKISRPVRQAELYKGLQPALISQEWFDIACHKLLPNPNRTTRERRDYTLKNPLSGVVFCSVCGKPLTRRPPTAPGLPVMLFCQTPDCPTVGSVLERVEDNLLEAMRDWLDNYKLSLPKKQSRPVDIVAPLHKSLAAAEKKLAVCEQQISRIHQLLEQGVYSVDVFLKRSAEVGRQQADLQQQLATIKAKIEADVNAQNAREVIIPKIENVLRTYPMLNSATEKNKLLKSVLARADYTKTTRYNRKTKADDLKIVIFPLLNELAK